MKYEWRKQEKELYGVKQEAVLVKVPKQKFIKISGKGNPNDIDFSNRVSVLYSLAYAIKKEYKMTATGEVDDFSVYPLEGVWKQKEEEELIKEKLEYTIMIRQPDFITEDMVSIAMEKVKKKKPNPLFDEVSFDTMEEETCVQILHIGAFDDEPASFEKMDAYVKECGLKRSSTSHREIYLSNANRVPKNKLKTILRYRVEK